MDDIVLLLVGLIITLLGVSIYRGNINSIHEYHRKNLKEEDIPKYARVMGVGTLLMGGSMIVSSALLFFEITEEIQYVLLPAVAIGLVIMFYGQFKFNKRLF